MNPGDGKNLENPGQRLGPVDLTDRYTGTVLFRAASLRKVYLGHRVPVDLSRANLHGLDLSDADFTGRDLSDADLTGTKLHGARYDARTRWPDSFDPVRAGAIEVPVDLSGANLAGQNLSGQDFSGLSLRGANLRGANLHGANLTGASLRGAHVAGANFTDANLTDADLVGIGHDAATRWPDGFDPTDAVRPAATPTLESTLVLLETLADPSRLRIIGHLSRGEATGKELAELLELSAATLLRHLARLRELQIVQVRTDGTRRLHRLDEARLGALLEALPRQIMEVAKADVAQADIESGVWERKVLESFFDGPRLREIPARYRKQKVVLTRIVQRFELGRTYTEREVSQSLAQVHPDFASLRRHLIDHRLMARENNRYWRL